MNRYKYQAPIWHLDKIIFAIASVYLTLVIIWLASKNRLWIPLISQPQAVTNPEKPVISPSDAEFIAYLERSLERIDRSQTQIARETSPATVPLPPTIAPPPPPPQTTQTIIEKVYVPVYPPSQPPVATAPAPAPKPATSPPPPPATAAKSTSPSETNPTKSLTLVGLLEAGDRAYALFDIQGTTRRFEPGEVLGSSGWTLMSVQDRQAIVYGNGKSHSLEVGQGF
ncbi:MAG: hypothetical protein MUD14_21555 [Hydrococcus sp. Prado102]|jgi:hypothetical protein|nr:hypothetical protein [Hydrococcus sp. Prado102]